MNEPHDLRTYREAGIIGRDDVAAAVLLVEMARRDGAPEPGPLAWLGMCLALRTVRDGHTCVDLARIGEWAGDVDVDAPDAPPWPTDAREWTSQLLATGALVGRPGDRKPFILDDHRLYLARAYAEEEAIAAAIQARAATGRIHILLGGPGTGKTTKVAADLVARFKDLRHGDPGPPIALAAPTGKAAARMAEVLKKRCQAAGASDEVIARVSAAPTLTVHKLLGYNPRRGDRYMYHAGNPLPYDLVIVDEASMLSSSLMRHLLAAVRPDAELRLVGDPDQLASVDSGTVLGDIAACNDRARAGNLLAGRIETLTTVHRTESRNILALAQAIRGGDVSSAFEILAARGADVAWVDPDSTTDVDTVLEQVTRHASDLRKAAHAGSPRAALEAKADMQVLCAHREGPMGVAGWNSRIEKRLGIRIPDAWYSGRPVLVTRNNRSLKLSNGDVGVVVRRDAKREAIFGLPDQPMAVAVSRLEHVETVHALTIHRSQGSEYKHVVVVLPERPSRIVTRELLYTGVTRASEQVTIIGSREVIEAAINTPIRRATGLADRFQRG